LKKTTSKDITNLTKAHKDCLLFKRQQKHHRKLPTKLHEHNPWSKVCVDLIGTWTINTTNNHTPITLLALTIINLVTSWFIITPKKAKPFPLLLIKKWLCKYPYPLRCIHDNGGFVVMEFQEMIASNDIQALIITIANPQANTVIEHIQHVIPNMVHIKYHGISYSN